MDSSTQFGESSAGSMGRPRIEITGRAQHQSESKKILGGSTAYYGKCISVKFLLIVSKNCVEGMNLIIH